MASINAFHMIPNVQVIQVLLCNMSQATHEDLMYGNMAKLYNVGQKIALYYSSNDCVISHT